MTELKTEKQMKLFQVAKELNLSHTTLMEFLNSLGYDTPKKHMSMVSEEMYLEVVKKFDQVRWRKLQEQTEIDREKSKRKEAERLREKEIDRILKEVVEAPEIEIKPGVPPKIPKPIIEERFKPVPTSIPPAEGIEVTELLEKPVPEVIEIERPLIPSEIKKKVAEQAEVEEISETKERKIKAPKVKAIDEVGIPAEPVIKGEKVATEISEIETEVETEKEAEVTWEEGRQMLPVDRVVAEALELARKTPKKLIPQEVEEESVEAAGKRKRKRARRRKKPRRPEAPSAAAVGMEMELRAKMRKKKKAEPEEVEPKKKRRKGKKKKIDLKEIDASIKETLAKLEEKGKVKHKRKKVLGEQIIEVDENVLHVTEFISAQELANLLDVSVTEVIKKALEMGLLISINQRLDKDTLTLLADEFGKQLDFVSTYEEELANLAEEEEAKPEPRAPVVTVMGHVDHGKTSLLDYIRRSNIIAGESGGITQHIGAYKVEYDGRYITFLDTPGHEAFTAMRARGAQVTDIVVLVVAADDQVMPQTLEAISHAQAANVPIIIAINKIDKSNAQPEKVKQQLAEQGILIEAWGGKYQSQEISAKFGAGVDKLMEEIVLLADMLELKAATECRAQGVIIDSKLDKGRGAIATVLIRRGVLKVGNNFFAGQFSGKVRAMLDERGHKIGYAYPSDPVQVLGFEGTPQAGDAFVVTNSEKEAKNISLRRQQLHREQSFRQIRMMTLDQISNRIKQGEIKELPLIIKGDVHGSVEAIADALMKLQTEEVKVRVIHKGVGAVTESDVLLASASNAVIIGFHVHANKQARELASRENVEIKSYRIIYNVIDDVKNALEGMLLPTISEEITGEVEVRNLFKISTIGTIAGCYVSEGKIERTSKVKIYREGVEVLDGELESLKRFKDDVREVAAGFECGLKIKNFNDIKVGDIIQSYKVIETKRTLIV